MKDRVTVIENQSLIDIALQQFVDVETLFEIGVLNNISITNALAPASSIKCNISEEKVDRYFRSKNYKVATVADQSLGGDLGYVITSNFKKDTTVYALANQSTLDITIQESGQLNSLFDLLINENISLTDSLVAGSKVKTKFRTENEAVKNYYKKRHLRPSTGFFIDTNVDFKYAVIEYVELDYWV